MRASQQALKGQRLSSITIIGAGVVGLATALAMQRAGIQVSLWDKSLPGQGCSYGNAGHFATELVLPLATPQLLPQLPKLVLNPLGPVALRAAYLPKILPWFIRFLWQARGTTSRAAALSIKALNDQALEAWQQLLGQTEAQRLLRLRGSLLVFESQAALSAAARQQEQIERQYGVPWQQWRPEQLQAQEPELNDRLAGAIWFPDTGHTIEPALLNQSLYQAFIAAGGTFVQQELQHLQSSQQGWKVNGEQQCEALLLACGAWSAPWVQQLTGVRIPLEAERGYHLMMPEDGQRLSQPVTSAERKFIMTPMQSGLRLAGTVEFAGLQRQPDMRRAQMLEGLAAPLLRRPLAGSGRCWMGCRPTLVDSLPILDRTAAGGKLLLALGHQHLGLTQAAISAQLLTDLALGQEPALDLNPYRLARFG